VCCRQTRQCQRSSEKCQRSNLHDTLRSAAVDTEVTDSGFQAAFTATPATSRHGGNSGASKRGHQSVAHAPRRFSGLSAMVAATKRRKPLRCAVRGVAVGRPRIFPCGYRCGLAERSSVSRRRTLWMPPVSRTTYLPSVSSSQNAYPDPPLGPDLLSRLRTCRVLD
jgi:hypothetical protein